MAEDAEDQENFTGMVINEVSTNYFINYNVFF